MIRYFSRIFNYLEIHPEKRDTLNPAFPYPQKIKIAILKKHLIVEYCGPENPLSSQFTTEGFNYPDFSVLDYLGVKHGNSNVFHYLLSIMLRILPFS